MNKKNERYDNLIKILDILRFERVVSRQQLKEKCLLQLSTITYLVKDLISLGLVEEFCKQEERKVGKPGTFLRLNGSAAHFLGVYVEDMFLDMYVHDFSGTQLVHIHKELEDAEDISIPIEKEIESIIEKDHLIVSVGIAVKGIVTKSGLIKTGKRLHGGNGWDTSGLITKLKTKYPDKEVIAENDANCVAVLEHMKSRKFNDNTIAYVINDVPFGIGIGIITNGKLYKGSNGEAGEFFIRNFHFKERVEDLDRMRLLSDMAGHVLTTYYLLNPERIVLTGSIFSCLTDQEADEAKTLFDDFPCQIEIQMDKEFSAPARGAVEMSTELYIEKTIGNIERRW